MDGLGSSVSFTFEGFRLDRASGGLVRTDVSGAVGPVALGSRALALLALLVERQGHLVSKDAIFATVWPGIVVGDGNLTVQISALRRVLDLGRTQGSCIQTIPGRGYRFIPAVTRVVGEDSVGDGANIAAAGRAMPAVRRLAAILAADVAEYSRLMGADEESTLAALRVMRREVIDPTIAEHRGRIVKTTGGGLLAEFQSVIDALRCASAWQAGVPADSTIAWRIGIHQGDVIVEDGDIFGDGVNVGARLEALAEPGGICVSGRVQEDAVGRLDLAFEDLGEQSLKNIARPVRAYALHLDAVANPLGPGALAALSISQPAVAPRLSIVVLPFTNLSDNRDQQYFADAITEDLTTDLSRIAGSFVISCNTAFAYRGRRIGTKQIGAELGVRYVLEGSVQRSGDQVRVNAQLIDAEADAHLWAERFVGDAGELFALQNEITGRIAVALDLELIDAEAARATEHPDALDYIFQGRAARRRPNSPENYTLTVNLFERALALDPGSVEAQCWLAITLTGRVLDQMTSSATADIARAEELVLQALAEAPRNPLARFAKGQMLRVQKRYVEAIPEYETVIALNRNNGVHALGPLGECKLMAGSVDEVIPLHEQAIRLSPRDPFIAIWYCRIGIVHLLQSAIDEAIGWLERARSANAELPYVHAYLASAYALSGRTERAAIELAEARKLSLDGRYSSIARLQATAHFGVPKIRALNEATYFVGLRKAGMPEA